MTNDKISEAFRRHISDPAAINEHFIYNGTRYVVCDWCRRLLSTDDCWHYGGEGYRMFAGECRECFKAGRHSQAEFDEVIAIARSVDKRTGG